MYDCVVVNLDRRGDRWLNMLLRLVASGLPCSRLSAADGSRHSVAYLLKTHDLPLSLFDGNNFNTSPPVAACAISHALAWRMQKQGRALLVMEDDVNIVLNARERIERLRQNAREVGAKLLMMAPGETFEEDTVTCAADDDNCLEDNEYSLRVLREKMTLFGQVLPLHAKAAVSVAFEYCLSSSGRCF
jgi:GR25 family glycosyltransferase involved in LPS biosynthesis